MKPKSRAMVSEYIVKAKFNRDKSNYKATFCDMIETNLLRFLLLSVVLISDIIVRCDYELRIGKIYSLSNVTSFTAYMRGVDMGIINMEKYPYQAFRRDEEKVFKDLYKEHSVLNESLPLNYEEWLIMNNYGLLPDTQESLFDDKISKRNDAEAKQNFTSTVKTGDILISGRGVGGLVGHAAIMISDYWVLEMKGGPGWQDGIPDCNRRVSKQAWFDEHITEWVTVFRCKDGVVAREAATWAEKNYYNPSGGDAKIKHVNYKITPDILSTDPSYCSKLVIHAYFYGTGKKKVIKPIMNVAKIIVPTTLPTYFTKPYGLVKKGKF